MPIIQRLEFSAVKEEVEGIPTDPQQIHINQSESLTQTTNDSLS
jgi:hypothetical protein